MPQNCRQRHKVCITDMPILAFITRVLTLHLLNLLNKSLVCWFIKCMLHWDRKAILLIGIDNFYFTQLRSSLATCQCIIVSSLCLRKLPCIHWEMRLHFYISYFFLTKWLAFVYMWVYKSNHIYFWHNDVLFISFDMWSDHGLGWTC